MSGKKNARKGARNPKAPVSRLDAARTRPLQIVHAAFVLSALSVLGITLLARPAASGIHGVGAVRVVSAVGLALWVGGYALGHWVFRGRLRPDAVEAVRRGPWKGPAFFASEATEADKLALHLRRAWVFRQVAWLVGPVICLFSLQWAIQGGLARVDPSVWTVGVIPTCIFLGTSLAQWPTGSRQRRILEKALAG